MMIDDTASNQVTGGGAAAAATIDAIFRDLPDAPSAPGLPLADLASLRYAAVGVDSRTWRRFWNHVQPPQPGQQCWLWTGATRVGYGAFKVDGVVHGAHRLLATWLLGESPDGLVVDHLCANRACVRPEHLDVVTHAENVVRGGLPHLNTTAWKSLVPSDRGAGAA